MSEPHDRADHDRYNEHTFYYNKQMDSGSDSIQFLGPSPLVPAWLVPYWKEIIFPSNIFLLVFFSMHVETLMRQDWRWYRTHDPYKKGWWPNHLPITAIFFMLDGEQIGFEHKIEHQPLKTRSSPLIDERNSNKGSTLALSSCQGLWPRKGYLAVLKFMSGCHGNAFQIRKSLTLPIPSRL